jgi:sulfoxide reductase heme-binding subunit YedZ
MKSKWKIVVFVIMSMPLMVLASQWTLLFLGEPAPALGANPVQQTVKETGEYAIRALVIALGVSPLASLLGRPKILAVRRMLGLFAFFYASLHGLSYIGLDQLFNLKTLIEDVLKRWPITLGVLAWLCLLPLALTSTARMVRRLGPKGWKRLHKLVYAIAGIVVFHNILIVKGWQTAPLVYGAIFAALLLYRVLGRPRLFGKAQPA